jgi:hypothetical protein
VPATSAAHNRLLFFAVAVYSTNEANKAGLKQSIFLDVYGIITHTTFTNVNMALDTYEGSMHRHLKIIDCLRPALFVSLVL